MKKYDLLCKDFPHFLHGGDYNPEQWIETPEIWDEDMKLMKEANCNEMTVGIFSWAELEPEEGVFNFGWLDTIIDKVYQNGGRVVLATPSGARPKWLADKYPEVLRTTEDGHRNYFGARHNHCSNSPVYREKVRIINEKIAERYGKHPAVVAWHLSNEYSVAGCYCEHCVSKFREWLKNKYDNDIDKVNHAWWSRFWSHTYRSFEQIEPPRATGETRTYGLNLDWRRFLSDSTIEFASLEAETVRKYSDIPVTTNCMCYYPGYDLYKMSKFLDVMSNDFYPVWSRPVSFVAEETASVAAIYRGAKDGKPFMVMESAPGINNCGIVFKKVKTDEEQFLEAMLYVACGADTVQYFQWRKGRGAGEKFHGAVVDHYGKSDNRVFQTVKRNGEALQKIEGVLGCGIQSEVAIVRDYETIWALDGTHDGFWTTDPGKRYLNTHHNYFRPAWENNIPIDIIGYEADFSKYKVLCLPIPHMMTEKNAEKLKKFVADGGVVISSFNTAIADESDLCYLGGAPGAGLSELFGLRVDEVDNYENGNWFYNEYAVMEHENSVIYKGKEYPVKSVAELIIPSTAETLAYFTQNIEKDKPAVLKNSYGKGTAYYVGYNSEKEFMDLFMKDVFDAHGIKAITDVTSESKYVRVTCREGDGERYIFVLNLSREEQTATINGNFTDLLTGNLESGTRTLKPLEVLVLK